VVCLSIGILVNPSDVAEAGPFRDFFRAIRGAVAHAKEKPRPHRRNRNRHKHDESPSNDVSKNKDSASPSPATPNRPDVRWAKAAPNASEQKAELLYGTPVPGKPGLVTSPFAPDSGYVDVTGFPPGTSVQDPYTGKIFLAP
jgi:hypothetical protein